MDAPHSTGKPPQEITITGTIFPWDGMRPVFLTMPGSHLLYIACFERIEDLESVMGHYGIGYASVKQIDDGVEFLEGINDPCIAVILNARLVPETGALRFLQVQAPRVMN